MTKYRLLFFKILAFLTPLVLLVLLEMGLRLLDYGHDLSLFIKDPERKGYLVMNKFASEKYFSRQQNATIGNYEPFLEKKGAGVFRIFVLGESTTIGYPYMHNGSFHRWLQYRLLHTYPNKDFEIINLSLTAVNSHTVLDFAKGIVDYEPDAVLVYTGHNEYYGALGATSTGIVANNPFLIKLLIRLRTFRLVQLLSNTISGTADLVSGNKPDLRENLMKRMAADQQIPFGSDKYRAGIEQFKNNMDALCKVLSSKKVPLLLANLVSNEKDLRPLMSLKVNADLSADFHFQAANQLYKTGNFTGAKQEYIKAKELDILRFRAPEVMNTIIKDLAKKYPGTILIDTKTQFEEHSLHAVLGSETLLEHVHPNLYGYGLLSEAFYQGLKKNKLIPPPGPREMTIESLQKQMPITSVDSLKGAYEVMILKEGWPFNAPMAPEEKREKTIEERLAGALVVKQISWRESMNQLQNHLAAKHDSIGVLKVIEALVLENPLDLTLYDRAGKLSLLLNLNETGITYLSAAFRKENSFERARQLFVTLLKIDKSAEALKYIEYAAANNTSRFSLNELHTFVKQHIINKERFANDSTNVNLSNQIASDYVKFANVSAAQKYVKKSLELSPGNKDAIIIRHQLKMIRR